MVWRLKVVYFVPDARSTSREEIYTWVKGIGSKVSDSVFRESWSLERAGKEPMQEKDFGTKDLPGAEECAPL